MKRYLHKIFGFYKLKVNKTLAERVINIIIKNKLSCFEPSIDDEFFYIKCTLWDMSDLSSALEGSNIFYEIIDTSGIPFIINRYKCRKGLFFGTILGIITIAISINFIWDIEFINSDFSPTLLEKVELSGVSRGSFIPFLNILESENRFLLDNDEYSFVAFNVKGTVVYVELKKRNGEFSNENKDEEIKYSNIVANDNGIVVKVEAYSGFPIVSKGQIVLDGQILISGAYNRLYGGVGFSRSRGKVFAECARMIEFELPLQKETLKLTGRSISRPNLKVFGISIPLYLNSDIPFEYSYVEEKYRRCTIFGSIKLPFDIYELIYLEEKIETTTITLDEAKDTAIKEFENRCETIVGGEGIIKEKKHSLEYNKKTNSLKLIGELVYIKNIAYEKEFIVN